MTSNKIVSDHTGYEAAARVLWGALNERRPMTPMPEVTLLLDPAGRIVERSAKFPGERLSQFSFARNLTFHDVFHASCDGSDCHLADNFDSAWASHASGLPVEWFYVSQAKEIALRLRLQPVNYACSVLFGGTVHSYNDHSVLFVQDVTAGTHAAQDNAKDGPQVRRAEIYQLRRSTDPNPNLVASMDDRLRTITSRLLVSQDTERKRIASELHDSLGQSLSLLRLELEGCLNDARTNDGTVDVRALERTHEHTRRALEELRSVVRNLRPAIISDVGLEDSLDILCRDFQASQPEVSLVKDLSGCHAGVPDDVAVAVYRIAQEALNNTARHAKANSASISFTADESAFRLAVSDDGCGLPSSRMPKRGLGLITMRERAETLGGAFEIESHADWGSKIRVTWPRQKPTLSR
jgi:signal transduction histidine kinase